MPFSSSSWVDKNHNPRKGTETALLQYVNAGRTAGDKNHNPRKGTETIRFQPRDTTFWSTIRTIIPVRGRKQSRLPYCRKILDTIRTIIPVRGRKRLYAVQVYRFCFPLIRTTIPARGRKRKNESEEDLRLRMLIRTTIPAKGRVRKKSSSIVAVPLVRRTLMIKLLFYFT